MCASWFWAIAPSRYRTAAICRGVYPWDDSNSAASASTPSEEQLIAQLRDTPTLSRALVCQIDVATIHNSRQLGTAK